VPVAQYDLASVVLHEIGHGLGFASLAKKSGTIGSFGLLQASDFSPIITSFPWPQLDTLPGIFDRFIVNSLIHPLDTFANPSTALGAQLTNNNIYFNGSNALAANGNIKPRMYAPSTFSLGSSILHLNESTYPTGNINELMTPNAAAGNANHNPGPICIGILKDIGWTVNPYLSVSESELMKDELLLYPNPAENQLAVSKRQLAITKIDIYDALGRHVYSRKPEASSKQQIAIDVSDLAPGIYFLKIISGNSSAMKKVIKN